MKMHNKDSRVLAATVPPCRSVLAHLCCWPMYQSNLHSSKHVGLLVLSACQAEYYHIKYQDQSLYVLDICWIFCSASHKFLGQSPSFRCWLVYLFIFKGTFNPLMFKRFIALIISLFSPLLLPFDVTSYYKASRKAVNYSCHSEISQRLIYSSTHITW